MKKIILPLLILLSACNSKVAEVPSPDNSDTKNVNIKELTEILNQNILPLKAHALDNTDLDLAQLNVLKDTKVIGLGEATHGTKEFFQMKMRLFQYFVKHFNHKVFAFEMDYGESLIFDEYIQTGKGDLTQLMKDKMIFWTWCTAEVRDLLEWMKDYNIDKAPSEKLHIYGIDCQYFVYNIQRLHTLLGEFDASLTEDLVKIVAPNANEVTLQQANDIGSWLKGNKEKLLLMNPKIYDEIEHLTKLILQTAEVQNETSFEKSVLKRDQNMGENTIWLSKRTEYPMTVWAHNQHVSKSFDATDVNTRFMGFFINQGTQGNYTSIGFSFSEGTATAQNFKNDSNLEKIVFPTNLKSGFLNNLLGTLKFSNYFYKSSDVYANPTLRKYMNTMPFYQIGLFYNEELTKTPSYYIPLSEGLFDYMIHFNKSTASDCYRLTP